MRCNEEEALRTISRSWKRIKLLEESGEERGTIRRRKEVGKCRAMSRCRRSRKGFDGV